jgi:hypothetical protein
MVPAGVTGLAVYAELSRLHRSAGILHHFTDVFIRVVDLWPASRLDEFMPWA